MEIEALRWSDLVLQLMHHVLVLPWRWRRVSFIREMIDRILVLEVCLLLLLHVIFLIWVVVCHVVILIIVAEVADEVSFGVIPELVQTLVLNLLAQVLYISNWHRILSLNCLQGFECLDLIKITCITLIFSIWSIGCLLLAHPQSHGTIFLLLILICFFRLVVLLLIFTHLLNKIIDHRRLFELRWCCTTSIFISFARIINLGDILDLWAIWIRRNTIGAYLWRHRRWYLWVEARASGHHEQMMILRELVLIDHHISCRFYIIRLTECGLMILNLPEWIVIYAISICL